MRNFTIVLALLLASNICQGITCEDVLKILKTRTEENTYTIKGSRYKISFPKGISKERFTVLISHEQCEAEFIPWESGEKIYISRPANDEQRRLSMRTSQCIAANVLGPFSPLTDIELYFIPFEFENSI